MFTRQAPPIINSLMQSGASGPTAHDVGNFVGQCRAELRHNGPIVVDYTRPYMRELTPETSGLLPPGPEFPPPEAFPKPPAAPPVEPGPEPPTTNAPPPEFLPVTNPNEPGGPGAPPNPWGPPRQALQAFPYLFYTPIANRIGVKAVDQRRHTVFPSNFNVADQFHSVDFKGHGDGFVAISITDNKDSTDFTVSLTGAFRHAKVYDTSVAPHALGEFTLMNEEAGEEDLSTEEPAADTLEAYNAYRRRTLYQGEQVILAKAKNGAWYVINAMVPDMRLARTTSEHDDNDDQDVGIVYEDSCATEGTGPTVTAWNRLGYKIPANALVWIKRAKNGCWYIIKARAQSCLSIAGHDLEYVTGYISGVEQALTHDADDCLKWVTISECA